MKENVVLLLALLLIAGICFQDVKTKDRYEVVTSPGMLTIMVDKKTGETWRNCICDAKSNVPGCWEKMYTINPEDFNKPKGEAKAIKKMIKLQKKQLKLQEKLQKTQQPVAPQPQENK